MGQIIRVFRSFGVNGTRDRKWTFMERFVTRWIVVLVLVVVPSCGGPTAPEQQTEAQVIVTGVATWTGVFGTPPHYTTIDSGHTSDVLSIGLGRQCANVSKHVGTGTLTIRVGDETGVIGSASTGTVTVVCGEGRLR